MTSLGNWNFFCPMSGEKAFTTSQSNSGVFCISSAFVFHDSTWKILILHLYLNEIHLFLVVEIKERYVFLWERSLLFENDIYFTEQWTQTTIKYQNMLWTFCQNKSFNQIFYSSSSLLWNIIFSWAKSNINYTTLIYIFFSF